MSEKFNQSESSFRECRISAEYCNRFKLEHNALVWENGDRQILLTYANTRVCLIIDDAESFYSNPYNHIEIKLDHRVATAIQITPEIEHIADYLMENEYPVLYNPVPDMSTIEWLDNVELGKAALELADVENIIEAWEVDDEN